MREGISLSLSGVFMEKIYLGFSIKSSMFQRWRNPCVLVQKGLCVWSFLFSAIFEGGSLRALEGRFAA